MNFKEMNYILCIAKHQNLTKAAQELYISQPTLTKYLQKLEQEVGGKLFARSGNSYIATYLGRRYGVCQKGIGGEPGLGKRIEGFDLLQ